ncbi:MAG: hypothetical protein O2971_02690 [Proteobacteria bacterium]|nr:hypothetical protein [Pseudomonadota bacterium]
MRQHHETFLLNLLIPLTETFDPVQHFLARDINLEQNADNSISRIASSHFADPSVPEL